MTAVGYTSGDPRKVNVTGYVKGDVLAANAAGTLVAIPVGTDGDALTAESADPEGVDWITGGGGGGSLPANTVVSETAFGQVAAAGIAATHSRGDHTHGTPAAPTVPGPSGTVTTETSFGQGSSAGGSSGYSRGDHTHGTPPAPTAASVGADAAGTAATAVATHEADTTSVHGIANTGALVLSSRQVLTSSGLQGGGDLSADRTISPTYGSGANQVTQGNDARLRELYGFPAGGYGLVSMNADPMMLQGQAGINGLRWYSRLWVPANTPITGVWAAVRIAGTYDGSSLFNTIGLYDDAGVLVDKLADTPGLWGTAGWRGGNLPGGVVAAQSAGRFVYVVWQIRGFGGGNPVMPFPANGTDGTASYSAVGVAGGNRRAAYESAAASADLPASFNPTSIGTATGSMTLVGVS